MVISFMVILAPLGEVEKVLSLARLVTHKLPVFVHTVVGFKLLATTIADEHMVTVLPTLVLVWHWQRLE